MSKPETKTVLGRVFTWSDEYRWWACPVVGGVLTIAGAAEGDHCAVVDGDIATAVGRGPTEVDAILALQSTLRKMAELEVK